MNLDHGVPPFGPSESGEPPILKYPAWFREQGQADFPEAQQFQITHENGNLLRDDS